jgi:hypothetical protein
MPNHRLQQIAGSLANIICESNAMFMNLRIDDIKKFIQNDFGSYIIDDGFVYKKTANEFIKIVGDFNYIINIWPVSWSSSYSVDMKLRISQRRVEDILEKILGKQRHRLTFSQDMLERIYYSPDGRKIVKGEGLGLWLYTDDDVYTQLQSLKIYYDNIAKPYFSKFADIDAMDDFINNPPFEHSPAYVGAHTNERCMKGLIIAKLVGNPTYDKLIGIYDEVIKRTLSDVQPDSITNYDKVKEFLEQNSI